jgi:hypothetical protein
MTCHVIGLGYSAKNWDGSGYSLGVNDAAKWGFPLNELILVNKPSKFAPERLREIKGGKYWKVYSHKPGDWKTHFEFPEETLEQLPLSPFVGRVRKGIIYKSGGTSPFIAMSKAFVNGATEIILWGVDFKNHRVFKPGSSALKKELFQYKKLIEGLAQHGVSVYLGASGSALEDFVEIKK